MMRAKVKIKAIEPHPNEDGATASESLSFMFPCRPEYPSDGSDKDQQFAMWTPSATLEMQISNPALIGRFKVGDEFYLDFNKIE